MAPVWLVWVAAAVSGCFGFLCAALIRAASAADERETYMAAADQEARKLRDEADAWRRMYQEEEYARYEAERKLEERPA